LERDPQSLRHSSPADLIRRSVSPRKKMDCQIKPGNDEVADVFAQNRAVGRIALSVRQHAGATRRARLFEEGPLRLRCPNSSAGALEAVIINTAGGIVGGDSLHIDLSAHEGAHVTVTTAAAEKVYRSLDSDAAVDIKLKVGSGAVVAWLPQETILFDQARLQRTIDMDVAGDAQLVFAEAVVFGRSGRGEQVALGRLFDRWRLHCAGRLLHAEALRFDGAIAAKLAQRAVTYGKIAVATVLIFPGDEQIAEAMRRQTFCGEVGVSAWKGMALARLCAPDGAVLKRDLAQVIHCLQRVSIPRLWSN
jgi:urease accessory protein